MSVNEVAVVICHKISGNLGLIVALDTKGIVFLKKGCMRSIVIEYYLHAISTLPVWRS